LEKDPLLLSSYDYSLPSELIALSPANPRESSKLLVYNRASGEISHDTFADIQHYIPKDYALFFNDTKVVKARILGKKGSGGAIEFFFEKIVGEYEIKGLIKGRVKPGTTLVFDKCYSALVLKLEEDNGRVVTFFKNGTELKSQKIYEILEDIGHIPLPVYIKREDNEGDKKSYQSVFAKNSGALAAPTASLHFSEALFDEVCKNYKTRFLTLHVGLGTFLPVSSENIKEHKMHLESYEIPKEGCEIIDGDEKILCVGTTALRSVEHYYRTKKPFGECDIFLNPTNPPKRANGLLTNFHLPKSTLLMLVSSIIGLEKTLELYNIAIEKRYRFYSYGDAMLVL